MFAMTWSDGPTLNIPELLTTLSQKNVKVTFSFVTQYLTDPNVQSIVQQAAAAGHLIGLRTEPSWNLLNMTSSDITSGIVRLAGVMAQFSGYTPTFMSLPVGGYNDAIVAAVEAAGMIIVEPNLDSMDYNTGATSTSIFNNFNLALELQANGAGNFISVQRDAVIASVQEAGPIIDLIRSFQYQMVMLDACVGNVAPPAVTTFVTTTSTTTGASSTKAASSTKSSSSSGTVGQVTSAGESTFATQFAIAQLILGVIGMLLLTL